MPNWWPDEQHHAGAEHLDPDYVTGYDAKAQFDPSDDIAALVRCGLGPGRVVVDMGAGTGVFALAAAALGAEVVAVDPSAAMAASLRHQAERSGLELRVVEAGFLTYEHEGASPDIVFSRNALHQLPDFWKVVALHRMAQLLRPGAVLHLRDLVYDLDPSEIETGIEAWMAGAVDDPTRGYTAPDLADHVRDEFSTFGWILTGMLERTGFEVIDASFHRSVYGTFTCRRR